MATYGCSLFLSSPLPPTASLPSSNTRSRTTNLKSVNPRISATLNDDIRKESEAESSTDISEPKVMLNFLKEFETKLDIKITCSQGIDPLGLAGPLALARDKLIDGSAEPFFILNSDIISEYPFAELVNFHKTHGGEATIMVNKVDEPSKLVLWLWKRRLGKSKNWLRNQKYLLETRLMLEFMCLTLQSSTTLN